MDMSWLSAILTAASCLALGFCISRRPPACILFSLARSKGIVTSKKKAKEPYEIDKLADVLDDFKMVLVVRNDLKMGKGKIAAQCSCTTTITEVHYVAALFLKKLEVLVVRNDLKMGKGKIAAQCSHATLGLYKKLLNRAPKALNRWEMCAQPKVVLKIDSEEEMLVLQERAKALNLPTHITVDAGRTQIAPNSRTVMAILGPVEVVDDVTGGLKLM